MEQSKAESFTAYLQAKLSRQKTEETAPVAGGTAFSVLAVLARNAGLPMVLPDLQAASGMSFTGFAEAIKKLEDSGYITLTGAPGSESAELTALGSDVAALARPA
jgi:hypothetical protein